MQAQDIIKDSKEKQIVDFLENYLENFNYEDNEFQSLSAEELRYRVYDHYENTELEDYINDHDEEITSLCEEFADKSADDAKEIISDRENPTYVPYGSTSVKLY